MATKEDYADESFEEGKASPDAYNDESKGEDFEDDYDDDFGSGGEGKDNETFLISPWLSSPPINFTSSELRFSIGIPLPPSSASQSKVDDGKAT